METIGYARYQSVYQLDVSEYMNGIDLMYRIPKLVAIRNEERRKYHKQNEIAMKKLLHECLQSVFKGHDAVDVVVLDEYNMLDRYVVLIIATRTNQKIEYCQ